jgi:hypothetical protein
VAFSINQTLVGGVLSELVSATQVAVIQTEAFRVKSQVGVVPKLESVTLALGKFRVRLLSEGVVEGDQVTAGVWRTPSL